MATVLSATAPLDDKLIKQVEGSLNAELFEIYGCSEVGSLASRFPSHDKAWQFFDCFDLTYREGSVTVEHDTLLASVTLADQFKQLDAERYEFEGRNLDIIKIGGKRESLANLNQVLLNISGVEDGVIYDPARYGLADTGRLAALVVSSELTGGNIRSALAREIEPAFMPRPIRIVEQLPRDTTSKLKQADLAQLIVSQPAND